jgi:hypothetical protein
VTTLPGRLTVSAAMFHTARLRMLQVGGYTRADLNVEWPFGRHFSVMAVGQNLLDDAHHEFATPHSLIETTQVPRSIGVRLRWTSR